MRSSFHYFSSSLFKASALHSLGFEAIFSPHYESMLKKRQPGTKTITSYSFNDAGKKVKTTRRIRTTVVRETVNPRVAERKGWSKFGLEAGHAAGPSFDTTSVGENIIFRPSVTWKRDGTDEVKKAEEESMKDKLRDKKV